MDFIVISKYLRNHEVYEKMFYKSFIQKFYGILYTGCVTKIQTNRIISLNEILLTKKLNITKNSFIYHVVGPYKV